MEIKVNDYVRYKYENCIYIGKIKFISEVMGFEETLQLDIDNCIEEILKEDVIKSSPNIIDLIEENDVIKFWYEKEKICYVYKVNDKLCVWDGFQDRPIEGIHIISVLTKEMFEQMEYKID